MSTEDQKGSQHLSIEKVVFQKQLTKKWLSRQKQIRDDENIEMEHLIKDQQDEQAKNDSTKTEQPKTDAPNTVEPIASPKISFVSRLRIIYSTNFPISINPLSPFYYMWLIIVSVCYLYNLIFLIARTAFWLLEEHKYYYIWHLIDYFVCDFVYILDMFIRFRTGFLENGEICMDKTKISKRYTKTFQFKLDCLSLFPTDAFYLFINSRKRRILPALRLNRLVRFSRYAEFLSLTETETKYPTIFRMSHLLFNILLAMHWNACIYFIISYFVGFGRDHWVFPALTSEKKLKNLTQIQRNNMLFTHHFDAQYVYCFWWSVQTLTTIAEVAAPTNYYQEMYMSVLLMIGVVILAITIGSAGEMVQNANRQNIELQMKCDYAKSFLKQNKITGQLEQRIINYLDYLWIAKDVHQDDVLDVLPENLRKAIAMNVHMETMKRVHVFQDCEPGLLEELVTKLKLQIYSPGDYVCRKGDVGHEMYFIKTGALQVVSPDGTQVYATLGAGAAFGEISILDIPGNKNGNKRTANIRSLGFSDVFQLSKKDLWAALSEYPVAKKTLLEKGKALLKKDNLLDLDLAEKLERKQKPIYEQVEMFQKVKLDKLNQKLDEILKVYNDFLKESKKSLIHMEKNFLS